MKSVPNLTKIKEQIALEFGQALQSMATFDRDSASQYEALLGDINIDEKVPAKMLKIVREFIRADHNFPLKYENALLRPIFTAIEEDRFAPVVAKAEPRKVIKVSSEEEFRDSYNDNSEEEEISSESGSEYSSDSDSENSYSSSSSEDRSDIISEISDQDYSELDSRTEPKSVAKDESESKYSYNSLGTEDIKNYISRAAQIPVLKKELLDEFYTTRRELHGSDYPFEPILGKRKRSDVLDDSPLMAAINNNDVGEVRKLLANNAPLDKQVEEYTRENYPLMYMQLGTQYSTERRILGQLKIAKYADHVIENKNIQAFMSSEQRYMSDSYFDVDLFAKRLSCAHSSENNIVEKLANVKAYGAFKGMIDQIINKIQNPRDIIIDGPAIFAADKASSSIGK